MIDIIYCAGDHEQLMRSAFEAGYLPGMQSGRRDYGFPISFVDIDYKKPNWARHLEVVERFRPRYAVVPDLSEIEDSEEDAERAVKQADELGAYCDYPLIVPKRSGQLRFIPSRYAIAYSVPTTYGGAKYGIWKLQGRRVHLLGGSPHEQMKLYRYLPGGVLSADGNMPQKIAIQYARYWRNGRWIAHPERNQGQKDLYLDCWQRSCHNIRQSWQRCYESSIRSVESGKEQ